MLQPPKAHHGGFVQARPARRARRTGSLAHAGASALRDGLLLAALLAVVAFIAATSHSSAPSPLVAARPSTLPDPRVGETATRLPDGRVLVAGGESVSGRLLSSAELYDPRSATWTPTGSMHAPRWHHTATLLLDGTVLVAGGMRAGDLVSSPETFDPHTGKWTLVAPARPQR